MLTNDATSVEEYLDGLPPERRAVIAAVRDVILHNLPDGYQESVRWGGLSYEIPLERYPDTYNKQPLVYLTLAAQKKHFALYLMSVYQDTEQETWLREAFARAGKKFDMGKSCLRFRALEDLPLDVIGEIVAQTPPETFIARYEASRRR